MARAGIALGLIPIFGAAMVSGAALHLNTPAARRAIADLSNRILGDTFKGRVSVGEIHSLSLLSGISIQNVTVFDQNDQRVLDLEGIHSHVNVLSIAYNWMKNSNEVRAVLPFFRVDAVDAKIILDENGKPTLEKAFVLKKPVIKTEPKTQAKKPTPFFLNVERFELGHAHIEGAISADKHVDAEVSRLWGNLSLSPEQLAIDIEQTGFAERKLSPQEVSGSGNLHVRLSKSIQIWGDVAGHLGKVEVLARGLFEDGKLEASLSLPKVTPEAVQDFAPDFQWTVPVSLDVRLDAKGALPHLQWLAHIKANTSDGPETSIEMEGQLLADAVPSLSASLVASDIRPRLFGADLPDGRLRARADLQMLLGPEPSILLSAFTDPGVLDGQPIPAVDVHAAVMGDFVSARFLVHEPGAAFNGAVELFADERVRFFVGGDIPSLSAAKRLNSPVEGSVRFAARGTLDKGVLDSNLQATISNIAGPSDVELERADVRGRLHGKLGADPLATLKINTSVNASNLSAGGEKFDAAKLFLDGPLLKPLVKAQLQSGQYRDISISAVVDAKAQDAANVRIDLRHKKSTFEGKIRRVSGKGGRLFMDGFSIRGDGIGGAEGTLVVEGKELVGTLQGKDIDAGKLQELFGMPRQIEGMMDLDLDLKKTKKGRSGHIHFALEDGEAPLVPGISSMMTISFNNSKVNADGYIRLIAKPDDGEAAGEKCDGTMAQVKVYGGEGELPGALLDAKSWASLRGSVQVSAEDWDLRCLRKRLDPAGLLPVSELSGKAGARLRIVREAGQNVPSVLDFVLKTKNFSAAGPEDAKTERPAWVTRGVDVALSGGFDGHSGKVDLGAELLDPKTLVSVNTTVLLDLPVLLEKPAKRMATLLASPIMVSAELPERSLISLSKLAALGGRMPEIEGRLRLNAFANGTLGEPHLAIRAMASDVAKPEQKPSLLELQTLPKTDLWHIPLSLDTLVTYDSKQANVEAHVLRDGRERFVASARIDAELKRLVDFVLKKDKAGTGAPPWVGHVEATLHPMRLEELPLFAASGISGLMNAHAEVDSLNDKPIAQLNVWVPEFRIGQDSVKHEGKLSFHIRPHGLSAEKDSGDAALVRAPDVAAAELSISSGEGGSLALSAFLGGAWKDRLMFVPEQESAADLLFSAKAFRLNALQPFVAPHLSMVDGFLNGSVRVGWMRAQGEKKGQIEADMSLTEGAFYVPVLGQQFRDAHFRLLASKSGIVRLDDVGAEGLSGGVSGWAFARFDGFQFKDAAAEFGVQEGRELPLALEGVPLGRLRGKAEIAVKNQENEIFSQVRVPSFHLELPPTIGRNVQSLDRHADVKTSQPLEAVKAPVSDFKAPKVVVQLEIGQGEVKGQNLSLSLTTPAANAPRVEIADRIQMFGDIELLSGKFELLSKTFELDRGLIHLRGEEQPNPFVNISMHWDAPDGSRIFVDYVGTLMPITDDKIRFRSDPPRGKQEIVGMLVLGSEYEQATISGSTESSDTELSLRDRSTRSAASSIIAGLILDELGGLLARSGFSTSIVTTEKGALKTGLVYQRGTTTTQVSYESEEVDVADPVRTLGSNARRTGRTELSIDWRFHRNWLLRGSVGIGGDTPSSGIDLLWQYRY